MLNLLSHIFVHDIFCDTFYVPLSLLLYSHLPTAIIALVVGIFIFIKNKNIEAKIFFFLTLAFFIFTLGDLAEWFTLFGREPVMLARAIIEIIDPLIFILSSYFLYVVIKKRDIKFIYKIIWLLPLVPLFIRAYLNYNLTGYNWQICEVIESPFSASYIYYIDLFYLITAFIFAIWSIIKDRFSKQTILASTGVLFFMVLFFVMEYVLTGYIFGAAFDYNYFIYAFFGMPVLIAILAFMVVRYKTFNLKMFGAQALILALIALIGSEFFFLQTTTTIVLAAVTLIITGGIGINLIRSVKKEIEAREMIEKQEQALMIANKMQSDTTSLITHQIRSVFTDAKAGLSAIIDGDFGPVSHSVMSVLSEMYKSQEKGVDQVQSFLRAQKIESGTVQYKHESFDFKKVVEQEFAQGKTRAEGKSLQYAMQIDDGSYLLDGDQDYLTQVVANLIDNAIRYTPKGSIKVQLSHKDGSILYSVKDSGVGIKDEDKPNMFKKYGHGKDSRLINVESSGLGLYIVKGIVDAHKGKIWYDTEAGKGTTFYVELPVK